MVQATFSRLRPISIRIQSSNGEIKLGGSRITDNGKLLYHNRYLLFHLSGADVLQGLRREKTKCKDYSVVGIFAMAIHIRQHLRLMSVSFMVMVSSFTYLSTSLPRKTRLRWLYLFQGCRSWSWGKKSTTSQHFAFGHWGVAGTDANRALEKPTAKPLRRFQIHHPKTRHPISGCFHWM
jgi:hypothetical protein